MKKISPTSIAGISGLTLSLIYLFFYLQKVDISLFHYWQQSVPLSLVESLKIPGGISGLLADRILEFISEPLWGSMIVGFLVVIVFISLKLIFRKFESNPLFYAILIAALIPFFILFAHFRLPFELVTSLTSGLLLVMLYNFYAPRNLALKLIFNFLIGIVVYLIAGVPGLLVLIQVIIVQAVISKKYTELLSVLPLILLPLLYLSFNPSLTIKQACLGSFDISKYNEFPFVFYFSLFSPLLLLLVLKLASFVFSRFVLKPSQLISGSALLIVLGVLFFSTRASCNERLINEYRILQAGFNDEWDEVIQLSKDLGLDNYLVQAKLNRALYEKGNLLDDLFNYPQKFGEKGIFLDAMSSSYVAVHTSDFYYDLGFALETRHWATEAQMILVRHPLVLKHLVMSYIAIGQEEAALKYLKVLSGSRNYREWCDHIYTMLETNRAGEDPDIKFFRDNNPAIDFFAGTKNPVRKLKQFYSSNKSNQMAFEFLVAGELLKHNIGAVLPLLPDFEKHGYENFPRAVEEALMIYVARTGDPDKFLSSYSIRSGTVERFKDFNSLLANVDSKTERMRRVSKYRNTYWFYILFSSPYATKK